MLKYLIIKEFKQILRGGFVPKLLVMMPVMMICVFPFAANQEVKNLKYSVVDNDRSQSSAMLIHKISSSTYFTLSGFYESFDGALRSVEQSEADIILEIPQDFERNLVLKNPQSVMLTANGVNGMKSSLAVSYMQGIAADFVGGILSAQMPASEANINIELKPYYLFNPRLDYKVFMVPALTVMLLTLVCGFLPAFNIVGEKEKGTIEQINVTPVSRLAFILSKLIPYWLIGFFVLTFALFLAWLVYGLLPAGGFLTVYLSAAVYITVVSGLGLIISNYASTMQQAMFLIFFFMLIFILMSGLFTPVSSMPKWAQAITTFNPLKYFVEIMRMIYLKGSGLNGVATRLLSLALFSAVLNIWAVISYKKTE